MRNTLAIASLLLLSACGAPSPEASEEAAVKMRTEVRDLVEAVAAGLQEQGIEVSSAAGGYGVCGGMGMDQPGVDYAAGMGTTAGSGPIAEQLDVVRAVLEAKGWDVEASPTQVLAREGDVRLGAGEARADADRGTLAIEVVRECEDMDEDVVDRLISRKDDTLIDGEGS